MDPNAEPGAPGSPLHDARGRPELPREEPRVAQGPHEVPPVLALGRDARVPEGPPAPGPYRGRLELPDGGRPRGQGPAERVRLRARGEPGRPSLRRVHRPLRGPAK